MKLSCRELMIVIMSLCGIGFFGALLIVDQVGFFHVLGEVHDVIFMAVYGVFAALKIVFWSLLAVGVSGAIVVGYREWGVVRPGKYGPAQAIKRCGKDPYELRQPMSVDEEKLRKQMILTIREMTKTQARLPEIVDAESPKSIEAPRIRPLSLAQQLEQRMTSAGETESILGYDADGPRRGPWNKLHSFFVVGGSGSGKSSTVAYYAALGILHGARLLLIDPDSEFEESITHRIAALSPFFLCPPGIDPRSAKHVIEVAEQETNRPGPYPVIFIVDEFSTIMRHGATGNGEWKDIAAPLASVLEEYGQRGRKRQRTSIIIGQIAKATRTGGTELRESMTATFVHRLKPQQAGLVLDAEEAKQCQYLEPGEAMILLSSAVETYRMRIPYADQNAMSMVAQLMAPTFSQEPTVSLHREGEFVETGLNLAENIPEIDDETAWEAKVRRVRELRAANRTQRQILYQVWGVTPGGTDGYNAARCEYQQIIVWLNSMEQGV